MGPDLGKRNSCLGGFGGLDSSHWGLHLDKEIFLGPNLAQKQPRHWSSRDPTLPVSGLVMEISVEVMIDCQWRNLSPLSGNNCVSKTGMWHLGRGSLPPKITISYFSYSPPGCKFTVWFRENEDLDFFLHLHLLLKFYFQRNCIKYNYTIVKGLKRKISHLKWKCYLT